MQQTNLIIGLETRIAKGISYILHPLLMPTYGFFILLFTQNYFAVFTPYFYKLNIIGITFVFTFLLPLINSFVLLKLGRIKSLEMQSAAERAIPYGTSVLYYFTLYYLFSKTHLPTLFSSIILAGGIALLILFLVNNKFKISAHTTGIGGIAGALMGTIYQTNGTLINYFLIVLFATGCVAFARLKLQAHTPLQVYSGFLLGFSIELLVVIFV